ncbi:hypothetical protein ACTTAM_12355 [Rhodobacter capsulatus]|uniref:hypothetical protein n=1 Tax=Rhodobacter capsulatus TaxID=1061 RepID=UPI0040287579
MAAPAAAAISAPGFPAPGFPAPLGGAAAGFAPGRGGALASGVAAMFSAGAGRP